MVYKLTTKLKNMIESGVTITDNAEFIGEGAFRQAYAFGEDHSFVVKIPHQSGYLASEVNIEHQLNEIRIWQKLPDVVRHFFVPVVDYDSNGRWLVMPRVLSKELDTAVKNHIVDKVNRKLLKYGVIVHDVHTGNVGLDKNKNPVILDYGMGCEVNGVKLNGI